MRFLLLSIILCLGTQLTAQQTVTLRAPDGSVKQRTQVDARLRPTQVEIFADGKLQRRTTYEYNTDGLLSEEVTTLFDDHEYDLITQYSYDGDVLTGKLIGNNRSGRWSSEGYVYDAYGNLARIDHYRKNGTLAYQTFFDLTYEDSLLVEKVRRKVVLPVDSLHEDWENEVAIGDDPVPEPGEVVEAGSTTTYDYDARGRRTHAEERNHEGERVLVTETTYLSDGRRREKTTFYEPFGGVSFSETITYDRLGRMAERQLMHDRTRYAYIGDSEVVRREF